MKRRTWIFILVSLLLISLVACSNNGSSNVDDTTDTLAALQQDTVAVPTQRIIIDIEKLKAPDKPLPTVGYDKIICKTMYDMDQENVQFVARNRCSQPLVQLPHPFFDGMHQAYADHRPFVLSPDAVWLLICQGFSYHVNFNAEALRHLFVDFEGKKTLIVVSNGIRLDNPNSPWERYFPEFTKQIAKYVGDSLVNTLTCNFSTSTAVTRAASQITIMSAMQEYFIYKLYVICGIPQVILEGTPEDWHTIVERTEALRKYKLDWWVDELLPILRKIEKAANGEVDTKFWRGMYKQHDLKREMCGDPYYIADGWIVKFYPYDDDKHRSDFKGIADAASNIPAEIVSVPLEFTDINRKKHDLILWTGFVGLTQDSTTFALRPEIGWFITRNNNSSNK